MTTIAAASAVALAALLFFATPASAQDGETISVSPSSVAAEEGTYTVTVSGEGWTGAPALFVTLCSGAEGGDSDAINEGNATSACPTILTDGARGNPGDDGTWSYDLEVTVTQGDIDNGQIAILAGELAPGTEWSAGVNLGVGESDGDDMEDDAMADSGAESGLLAVIGGSVIVAGLLTIGLGRRIAKRS